MSGGVDSAVSALLLKRAGFDVHGLYMSNWEDDDPTAPARRIFRMRARRRPSSSIPLHRVSFAEQYRARVFDYFLTEYRAGRTPNPDVLCNREIKFGICLDYAGAARRPPIRHRTLRAPRTRALRVPLLKARDPDKDQSYFLHAVRARTFRARAVSARRAHQDRSARARARSRSAVFDKPDSTGICFIGERPFREFLARYIPTTPGDIVTERGEVVGRHRGLAFYTLGQRGGLEIGGRAGPARRRVVCRRQESRSATNSSPCRDTITRCS